MEHISFLKNRILQTMSSIEDITGKLFHESHPELESLFWIATDSNHTSKLLYLNNQLNKIVDEMNGEAK